MRAVLATIPLLLTWALTGPLLGLEPARDPIQIVRTGLYHADEVPDSLGEGWFGLFEERDRFKLQRVPVRVQKVHDPCVDPPGVSSGKRVLVVGGGEPLFLAKGLPDSCLGVVEAVFQGRKFVHPAEDLSWKLGGRWFSLEAFGTATDVDYGTRLDHYTVKLSQGRTSQTVLKVDTCYAEGVPLLLWVGDLDRDGIVDLLLDTRTDYRVTSYALFLSTHAPAESLVRKVAQFVTEGC